MGSISSSNHSIISIQSISSIAPTSQTNLPPQIIAYPPQQTNNNNPFQQHQQPTVQIYNQLQHQLNQIQPPSITHHQLHQSQTPSIFNYRHHQINHNQIQLPMMNFNNNTNNNLLPNPPISGIPA